MTFTILLDLDVNIEVLYFFSTKLNRKFLLVDKKQGVEQSGIGGRSGDTE